MCVRLRFMMGNKTYVHICNIHINMKAAQEKKHFGKVLESISNIACAVQRLVLCGLPGTWHMHFGVVCTNECSFRVWIKVNMSIEYAMSII